MIKQLFLWVILFSGLLFYQPKSIANEVEQPSTTIEARAYELNAEIVAVVELSANSPKKTHHLLEQLLGNGFTFNYAEQYLILLTKARVKQHQSQHQDVVELLEQAKLLRNYIDKKQQFLYNIGYSRFFFSDNTDTYTNSLDVSFAYKNSGIPYGRWVSKINHFK